MKEVKLSSVTINGELSERLRQVVGREYVSELVGDGSEYSIAGLLPALVVTPQTLRDMAAVVEVAGQAGACLAPWGGGTVMGRGHVPEAYDIALVTSGIADIVDFDVANLTVTVQAGMTLEQLQTQLGREKKFLPLNPCSPRHATVGGTVAANANGPGRFHYGAVRDLVLGMRVILANGESIHVGGKTMKNVAGYDLGKIFIGSHGSLGIVTEATFRLLPQPERQAVVRIAFAGLGPALDLVSNVLDSELLPVSLSVVTPLASEWVFEASSQATVLAVELNGSAETVDRQVRQMKALVVEQAAVQDISMLDGAEAAALLAQIRDFVCLGANDTRQLVFTANVPLSMAGQFVSNMNAEAAEQGVKIGCLIHGGTGTVNCLVDGVDVPRQVRLYNKAVSVADELGGHCVLERGSTELRHQVPVWGKPRADWELTRLLKQKFDPHGVLNRGRFVAGT